MNRQAHRVANPERVDLRLVFRLARERIVRSRRAIVVQPEDLAEVAARALGVRGRGDVPGRGARRDRHADAQVDLAVTPEYEASRRRLVDDLRCGEDVLDVRQRMTALEPRPGEDSKRRILRSW